ncbi:hypothetical protein XELAEV_18001021mg [Xenopus laevis]|nr:hypothetical protein XELAEV_18001021mg [Xenopus laevis]
MVIWAIHLGRASFHGDPDLAFARSFFHENLQVSLEQKLVAVYVLGTDSASLCCPHLRACCVWRVPPDYGFPARITQTGTNHELRSGVSDPTHDGTTGTNPGTRLSAEYTGSGSIIWKPSCQKMSLPSVSYYWLLCFSLVNGSVASHSLTTTHVKGTVFHIITGWGHFR